MDSIRLYSDKIERLKVNWKPKKEKGIHSELHAMAKNASEYFGESKKMMMYYGYIRKIGLDEARKRIALQKEQSIRNPAFFFKKGGLPK